jgi:hypothetical protein
MTDLVTQNPLNASPQPIEDPSGTVSGLHLGTDSTNIPVDKRLIFGIGNDGVGEWLENSRGTNGSSGFGIAFYGAFKERMRLTNNGQLGLGTTAPTATLHTSGSVRFEGLVAGSGCDLVADSQGNVFMQTSSARFKERVRGLQDDVRKLLGLEAKTFRYRDSGTESVGYLAEDLAEQGLDHLVARDDDGEPYSVHYKLIPVYLVELVKQQQCVLDDLRSALASVQERLGGLEPQPATG